MNFCPFCGSASREEPTTGCSLETCIGFAINTTPKLWATRALTIRQLTWRMNSVSKFMAETSTGNYFITRIAEDQWSLIKGITLKKRYESLANAKAAAQVIHNRLIMDELMLSH